jgi:hypothetical protein
VIAISRGIALIHSIVSGVRSRDIKHRTTEGWGIRVVDAGLPVCWHTPCHCLATSFLTVVFHGFGVKSSPHLWSTIRCITVVSHLFKVIAPLPLGAVEHRPPIDLCVI